LRRIFYDDNCAFCVCVANYLKKLDKRKLFTFSSLDGKKAKTLFAGNYGFLRKKNSIVLLEGKKVWKKSNAIFRSFWLLGGQWKFLGIFFVVPGFLLHPFYAICVRCKRH